MSDEKALANLEKKLVSLLAPSYLEATKSVLAKADRATATQAELRSARGLTIGAVVGAAIAVLLLNVTSVISPPFALLIAMACAGVGWADARYRAGRSALPHRLRELADAYQDILTRRLRGIRESGLRPEEADTLRLNACKEFDQAMKLLNTTPALLALEEERPETDNA
jgi:hypothetical protein